MKMKTEVFPDAGKLADAFSLVASDDWYEADSFWSFKKRRLSNSCIHL